MKLQTARILTGTLVATALMQAQVVSAQQACVEQADVSDAIIYAMPVLAESFAAKCASELSADGFWVQEGGEYIAQFSALSEQTWPGAARMLANFADADSNRKGGIRGIAEIFNSDSPETVRPFVDLTLSTLIGSELKTKDCGKVERGLELLSPLPPENVGGLMTFIFELADVKKPNLCPASDQ